MLNFNMIQEIANRNHIKGEDAIKWWQGLARHLCKTIEEICPAEADDVFKQALQSAHDELR